jgi:hypothetical protein
VAISFAVYAAPAICAITIKDVSFRLSQLSMTSRPDAFVSNAASRARARPLHKICKRDRQRHHRISVLLRTAGLYRGSASDIPHFFLKDGLTY